ncbi:MAG TPA: 4-hydroxy-tetrahydrodipicolinate reductase, partial [Bacteroidales bacterium]|nr:4-hydroxy-tetrahydrodipicolinate reductase [Bacteroidales bacterium]
DIEIVEAHHNKKVDAPSGTALMLAKSVSEGLKETPVYTYDRHLQRKPRDHEEIGIHSIRGGTIIGEHSVIFAGEDEVLTFSHSAGSRKMFAAGAVNAALFLIHKKPGMYDMNDLIGGKI